MQVHLTHLPVIIAILAVGTQAPAGPGVDEFEHNAGGWLATVSGEVLRAFDQFRPGVAAAAGCLGGTPGTNLYLAEGVVTLSGFDGQGAAGCAVGDSATTPAVSDGFLQAQGMLVIDFSPPVSAFYTYYGSLALGETVTMSLYSNGSPIAQLESDQSLDEVAAAGHGFVSDVLIDRIEFTSTENGGVAIGAFTGLLAGEGSLGTVVIPGYPGPNGPTVQLDFGAVFAPDCNDNGIGDAVDIAQGGSFDTNGNGLPDECEFSGDIGGAEVWESGRTVYLTSDLSVPGSLTIEPGVDVVPAAGVAIVVEAGGQLVIDGTAAQPVRLRPLGNDRWDGIRFEGGGGELRHAELERLTNAGITINGASPAIDSCTIRDIGPFSTPAPIPWVNCCDGHGGIGCSNAACQAIVCGVDPYCCNVGWDGTCATEAIGLCDVCTGELPDVNAYGVRVLGASNPAIVNTVIQSLTGGTGAASANAGGGNNGFNGSSGGGSQACALGGNNGAAGMWAGDGGSPDAGQNGGDAIGVFVGPGAAVRLASCRINDLLGGNAGTGGNAGPGGAGGDGGNGTGGFACGGNGAGGQDGGGGGDGADGGRGGNAYGVRLEQPASSVVEQNIITHLIGGNGANGGNGGNGGGGGDGGDGAFNTFSGGDGGNAGWGGWGGDAGDGGNGGHAQPISVLNHASNLVLSQNTVGGGLTRGTAAVAGTRGSGGPAGAAGSGAAIGGSNGSGGSAGGLGALGVNGTIGTAAGIQAAAGPSPVITASNNIVVPGNSGYSIGMQAMGNAVIVGDFNCFFDFNVMVSGGVAPGGNSIVANPSFVDANGADDLPGTEDDNRRLAPGSACEDTGGGAEIPPDAADLDGDADTAEPLPLDADGNPRVVGASVDIGAYELGSAPLPCPGDTDGDGSVDVQDLTNVIISWGGNGQGAGFDADLNDDGVVSVGDLTAVITNWGACP